METKNISDQCKYSMLVNHLKPGADYMQLVLKLSLAWIRSIHSIKAALLANARALIGIHNILSGSFSSGGSRNSARGGGGGPT